MRSVKISSHIDKLDYASGERKTPVGENVTPHSRAALSGLYSNNSIVSHLPYLNHLSFGQCPGHRLYPITWSFTMLGKMSHTWRICRARAKASVRAVPELRFRGRWSVCLLDESPNLFIPMTLGKMQWLVGNVQTLLFASYMHPYHVLITSIYSSVTALVALTLLEAWGQRQPMTSILATPPSFSTPLRLDNCHHSRSSVPETILTTSPQHR
jgi:hypothetical protein